MKSAIWLSLLCTLGCLTSANAFLGDDMVTIEREYGPPTYQGAKAWIFHSQQYRISVEFKDGRSHAEAISNFNKTPLTTEQLQALLQAQSGGKAWREDPPDTDGSRLWSRNGAVASYDVSGEYHILMLITRPEGHSTPKPAVIPSVPSPASAPTAAPRPPSTSAHDVREAETWSGFQEGRRIGNRRYREGFPRPSLEYLDNILAAVNADQPAAWKLGFKGGYLSAWENKGRDL